MGLIIKDIELTHFGMFHGKKITFEPGINIFAAPNESGKSTIHAFIRGMFYGIEKTRGRASKDDRYTRYEPWEHLGGYEGKLRFEKNGILYRIERSFLKSQKSLHLYDETNGAELIPAQEKIDALLGGMSESGFMNTVSIEQLKSATDRELIEELKNFAVNMGNTRTVQIDMGRSIQALKKKKKEFEKRLVTDIDAMVLEQEQICEDISAQVQNLMAEKDRLEQEYISLNVQLEEESSNVRLRRIEQNDDYTDTNRKINNLHNRRNEYADEHRGFDRFVGAAAGILILIVLAGVFTGVSDIEIPYFSDYWPVAALAVLVIGVIMVAVKLQKRRKRLSDMDREIYMLQKELDRIQKDDIVVRAESVCENIRNQVQEVSEKKNRAEWELETLLTSQDKEQEILQEIKEKKQDSDSCKQEIAAIQLALEELDRLTGKIHDTFGIRLNQSASDYFSQITGGKYTDLRIDEDFSIWINTKDKLIPIESCSRGTVEQIYLCIRLAAARILSPQETLPIILDDVFAYYDNERLAETLNILKRLKNQVIIFTCHTRESSWIKKQL